MDSEAQCLIDDGEDHWFIFVPATRREIFDKIKASEDGDMPIYQPVRKSGRPLGPGADGGGDEGLRLAAARRPWRASTFWNGPADHLRHTTFVALRDDKPAQRTLCCALSCIGVTDIPENAEGYQRTGERSRGHALEVHGPKGNQVSPCFFRKSIVNWLEWRLGYGELAGSEPLGNCPLGLSPALA